MHLLQIIDVGDSHAHLVWQHEGSAPQAYPKPLPVHDPLTVGDRRELRWYLEQYLSFPYGAERDRAAEVERRMAGWGAALFRQLFPKMDTHLDPRAIYQEAVRTGLHRCELCIRSNDPAFLNRPWELLRDPTPGRGYLAPSLGGLYREYAGQPSGSSQEGTPASGTPHPGKPFRVLLIIARPDGQPEMPLGTVARPVLAALRPLYPRVDLEVLRPPTFGTLERTLDQNPDRYQLVHFDGHGQFIHVRSGGVSAEAERLARDYSHGQLLFEAPDHGPDPVSSHDLGKALADRGVPLFVLSACQSAQEGPDPFSSVAAQLVATGARGVIAMSYSVHVHTATQFMKHLYQRLVAHQPLSSAVADARKQLYSNPQRPSVVGPLELRDWGVPVLYQRAPGYTPLPPGTPAAADKQRVHKAQSHRWQVEQICPKGRYGFVGRDNELLLLERALRDDDRPWAMISGMGGSGKTELAYGFARWYAETGGCRGGVYVTSFRDHASLSQVMDSLANSDSDHARLSLEEQEQRLVTHLQRNACLLVWDRFETVAGYPDAHAGEPPATPEERAKLARFAQALRGGKSRVLIVTRKLEEPWLGVCYSRIEIDGLNEQAVGQLARPILRMVGRRPEDYRDDPEYQSLLRLLHGHPRSLEAALPYLRDSTPAAVIDALQLGSDIQNDALGASLDEMWRHLSERAQRHLPQVGLFSSRVHVGVIEDLYGIQDTGRTLYQEVIGEVLDWDAWQKVLHEAAATGLLRPLLSDGLYKLHPMVPSFLRRQFVAAVHTEHRTRLNAEFLRFYAVWAADHLEDIRQADQQSLTAVGSEEGNLLRALRQAECVEAWAEVQAIAQTLDGFYEARARADDWRALRQRLLSQVGGGAQGHKLPASAGRDQASLWIYLLGNKGDDALDRSDLDVAEVAHREILEYLVSLKDPAERPMIAVAYHQLGRIAEERLQYNKAEKWYLRALEIKEPLGLEQSAAITYHQLGAIALAQQQLDQAETWYLRALEIRRNLGLKREAAGDYHQLGLLVLERKQHKEAESLFRHAYEIYTELGLEQSQASTLFQLGVVAQEIEQYEKAEGLFRQALEIHEREGPERDVAGGYLQLGELCQLRGDYVQAENWYHRALYIWESLGLEHLAAMCYHQLGTTAMQLQEYSRAEESYLVALGIWERLGHASEQVNTLAVIGWLWRLQGHLNEAISWYGRAWAMADKYEMPVVSAIRGRLAEIKDELGAQAFAAAWAASFPDQPPPV